MTAKKGTTKARGVSTRAAKTVQEAAPPAKKQVALQRLGTTRGQRSQLLVGGYGSGSFTPVPYEAASFHPSIPRVSSVGPINIVNYQPLLCSLARYYYRNDSWIRRIVKKMADNVVGTGPIPTSPFDQLNEDFLFWSQYIDTRGVHAWGDWVREDVYTTYLVDSDMFVRKRVKPIDFDAMGHPVAADGRMLPLQYQSLLCDQIPVQYNAYQADGSQTIAGVEFRRDDPDKRSAYWGYLQFPGDYPRNWISQMTLYRFPAEEMIHYFSPAMPGSPRGEVQLAAALIKAIKIGRLEDSEITRLDVASHFAGYIKESIQVAGESQLPGLIDDLTDAVNDVIAMEPGTIYRLPPGLEMQFSSPPQPMPMQKEVRYGQLAGVAACYGIPLHEVTMDFDEVKSDRVIKFASLSYLTVVQRERSKLANSVLRDIWRSFVDFEIITGRWKPPQPKDLWRAYQASWRWPLMVTSQISQEINTMIQAIEAGVIDADSVSQNYFGLSSKDVLRRQAEWEARRHALGFVPQPAQPGPDGTPGVQLEGWQPTNSPTAAEIFARIGEEEQSAQDVIAASL